MFKQNLNKIKTIYIQNLNQPQYKQLDTSNLKKLKMLAMKTLCDGHLLNIFTDSSKTNILNKFSLKFKTNSFQIKQKQNPFGLKLLPSKDLYNFVFKFMQRYNLLKTKKLLTRCKQLFITC